MTATTADTRRSDDFALEPTDNAQPATAPQRMGQRLWRPMLVLGLTGFLVGLILGFVRADLVSDADPSDADLIAALGHLVPGSVFLGFVGVFTGVSFAIARILGVFREGGGEVQSDLGVNVQTLRMPATGRVFMILMMLSTATALFAIVAHVVVAFAVPSLDPSDLTRSTQWAVALGGVRRVAAAGYLLGISMGLATIIYVIRFQSVRIRELGAAATGDSHG